MSQLGQPIVDFIAQLHPLYTSQYADGHECALSLLDGTLILPVDESSCEKEEGWVAVFWQGDSRRCSEVPGAQLASVALWRHLQSTGYGRSPRRNAGAARTDDGAIPPPHRLFAAARSHRTAVIERSAATRPCRDPTTKGAARPRPLSLDVRPPT